MAEVVKGTIQKWGNGLAIRLTQRVARASGFQEGTGVVIKAEAGLLVVETRERQPSLDERLARFDPKRHGSEAMAFEPVGREAL